MGLPGQPVLSGYREGEAWDGSLACLSESHVIKDLMRSIKEDKHSVWSAKGSCSVWEPMSGVSLAGY